MAEIPVGHKSNKSWLWVLLALIAVGLLLWWVLGEDDDVARPLTVTQVEAPLVADGAALPA